MSATSAGSLKRGNMFVDEFIRRAKILENRCRQIA